jgi:hypothetical protein
MAAHPTGFVQATQGWKIRHPSRYEDQDKLSGLWRRDSAHNDDSSVLPRFDYGVLSGRWVSQQEQIEKKENHGNFPRIIIWHVNNIRICKRCTDVVSFFYFSPLFFLGLSVAQITVCVRGWWGDWLCLRGRRIFLSSLQLQRSRQLNSKERG